MENFKGKTEKELNKILQEKRDALREFRFQIAHSKTKNVKEGLNLRKQIARILTELRHIQKSHSG